MSAAHDFNNLLTVIIGNAECALALLKPQNPLHEMVDDILTAAKRAGELTGQLQALASRRASAADASGREAEQRAQSAAGHRGARLLVVDDDKPLCRLAHRVLEEFGYCVESASDPLEALGIVREGGRRFELLVTDVVMPKMSGNELACNIRRLLPAIKVLYTSGCAANILSRHGVQPGDDPFLPKPYNPFELLRKVEEVLSA